MADPAETRRTPAQIRKKEIGRFGPLDAAKCQQFAVVGKQLEWGITRAGCNPFEVLADRGKCTDQNHLGLKRHRKLAALGQGEQILGLHRHDPRTLEIDELQRAAGLMHHGARDRRLRAVIVALRELGFDCDLCTRQ